VLFKKVESVRKTDSKDLEWGKFKFPQSNKKGKKIKSSGDIMTTLSNTIPRKNVPVIVQ